MDFTTITLPEDVVQQLESTFKNSTGETITEDFYSPVVHFLIEKIEEKGVRVNDDKILAEYYNYNVDGETPSVFSWHTDSDDGPISNCYTAVLYYHKSDTIKGGNLYYIDDREEIKCSVKANKYRYRAQLALFDGDIEHSVTDMCGQGVRQSVSFFIGKQ